MKRIDRATVYKDTDCFMKYREEDTVYTLIMGGGFFYTTRIFRTVYPENEYLPPFRRGLLTGDFSNVDMRSGVWDFSAICPQLIKKVSLSVPYLTETVRGRSVTYDDEMLYYRWYYYFDYLAYVNSSKPMVEGAEGNGTGMVIDIEYHIPCDNLVVLNGFVDLERQHLYRQNARMKKVLVSGDGFEEEYEFEDYVYFAQIDFPKAVTRVRLTVLEVYDGEKYDDLSISGFYVSPDIARTRNTEIAHIWFKFAEEYYVAPLETLYRERREYYRLHGDAY
jgi:hypothetical protein